MLKRGVSFGEESVTLNRLQRGLENHIRAFLFGLGDLLRAPIASTLTLFVIGIAMAFPAGLYALLQNFQQVLKYGNQDPTISVYLQTQVTDSQVNELIKQLQQRREIADVSYISPEQGLQQFQQQTQMQTALQLLPENPLPGIIVVKPRINLDSLKDLKSLVSSLGELPHVDSSQLDMAWLQRLYEIMNLGKRITYGLMFLFGIGVALIVANTMRLATQNHRQEIKVLRLIGATSAFIRRPMLYRGALYGVLGGLIACFFVSLLFLFLQGPAQELSNSYHDHWRLNGLSLLASLLITLSCAGLGLLGSWFAVQNYLREPEDI